MQHNNAIAAHKNFTTFIFYNRLYVCAKDKTLIQTFIQFHTILCYYFDLHHCKNNYFL